MKAQANMHANIMIIDALVDSQADRSERIWEMDLALTGVPNAKFKTHRHINNPACESGQAEVGYRHLIPCIERRSMSEGRRGEICGINGVERAHVSD
jgi:hypothetical protein